MMVNTENLVSITEANQNFSKVARLVDQKGSAVILKNNTPRYLVIEFSQAEKMQEANDEDLLNLSKRIIEKIERSMADRTSYFKESEEERNEMCEAMEKLIKEERSEERAETRLEMAISTATKMIKCGKYSDEEIIDLSDLSLEKVEQLRKVLTGN